MRKGIRTGDRTIENEGWELLREQLPSGPQPLALHALDATPTDGTTFEAWGRRAASLGLQPKDILVGIDEWRLRTKAQYGVLARLRHEPAITLTVWRTGEYQQLQVRMPSRWLPLPAADYHRP